MIKYKLTILFLLVPLALKAELYQVDRDGNEHYTTDSYCNYVLNRRWGWTDLTGWTINVVTVRENTYICEMYTNGGARISQEGFSMSCRDTSGNNVVYDASSPDCAPRSTTRTRTATAGNAFDLSTIVVDFVQILALGLVIITTLAGLIILRKSILLVNRS